MKKAFIILCFIVAMQPLYALTLDEIFKEQHLTILRTAAETAQASLGFDEINELVYVTFWSDQPADKKKIDTFNMYIAQQYKVAPDDVIFVYERLFLSMCMIQYLSEKAKEEKKWNQYYYYTDSLLPDTRRFVEIMKQAIIAVDTVYASKSVIRETLMQKKAINIMQYKETIYFGGL